MTQILIKLDKANIGENSDGGDFSDGVLEAGAIDVPSLTFDDINDRMYDVRGIKNVYFSITNQDGVDSLDWLLQETHDVIPTNRDLVGLAWVDVDAVAALAAGATATKVYTKPDVGVGALRLRTKRTAAAGVSTYKGRIVMGKYL